MPLATKNGSLIVKDGKIAENCGCCGGWYCYGCGEGFKHSPLSGFDCNAFGTVSINGVSSYSPYSNNSRFGCFSIQNGLFWQTKGTQSLCQAWVTGQNNNTCVRRYVRKQYHFVQPVFGNIIIRNGYEMRVYGNDVVQTTLDVSVSTESVAVCDDAGLFATTEVAVEVSSELRAQLGYLNSTSTIDPSAMPESTTVSFVQGFYSETLFLLLRKFQFRVLPADKNSWPILFDAVTLSGIANVTTVGSIIDTDTSITDWSVGNLPTSAPVVITPQLVDPGC